MSQKHEPNNKNHSKGSKKADDRSRNEKKTTHAPPHTVKAIVAPVAETVKVKPVTTRATLKSEGRVEIVKGKDFLGNVNITSTTQPGDVLFTAEMSPAAVPNGRLGIFNQLFERYEILEWEVEYVSSCPTSTVGQLYIYPDPDPKDPPFSGVPAIAKAVSAQGVTVTPVWAPTSCRYRPEAKQPDLFTSPGTDNRLSSAGNVFVVYNGATNITTMLGSLFLKYKIRYYKPILETGYVLPNCGFAKTASATTGDMFLGLAVDANSRFQIVKGNANQLKIPCQSGTYILCIYCHGGSSAFPGTGISLGTTSPTVNVLQVGNPSASAASTKCAYILMFSVQMGSLYELTMSFSFTGTSVPTSSYVYFAPLASTMGNALQAIKDLENDLAACDATMGAITLNRSPSANGSPNIDPRFYQYR